MNRRSPFLSLLAFQAKSNPYIWFMMLALLAPVFLVYSFYGHLHQNLLSLLSMPNLFFVGILGLWILAPEFGQRRGTVSSLPGTEFLLTLALDRRVLYRARVAFFYLFVLFAPALTLGLAIHSPDVTVTEYEKPVRLACLRALPGSTLQPDPSGSTSPLLHLPRGNVLAGEWHLWMFLAAALLAQLVFSLLFHHKHRTALFYSLFLGISFLPLAITLSRGNHPYFPVKERLFFLFAGHPALFWLASEALFIAGQLWCEERFIRQQY